MTKKFKLLYVVGLCLFAISVITVLGAVYLHNIFAGEMTYSSQKEEQLIKTTSDIEQLRKLTMLYKENEKSYILPSKAYA